MALAMLDITSIQNVWKKFSLPRGLSSEETLPNFLFPDFPPLTCHLGYKPIPEPRLVKGKSIPLANGVTPLKLRIVPTSFTSGRRLRGALS